MKRGWPGAKDCSASSATNFDKGGQSANLDFGQFPVIQLVKSHLAGMIKFWQFGKLLLKNYKTPCI
jgi:hypothetical protein